MEIEKYNKKANEQIIVSIRPKEYYALVYEHWNSCPATLQSQYNYKFGSMPIYSRHYWIFGSEVDRDRFIREEVYREWSDNYYKAIPITKKELQKMNLYSESHVGYRYFDENGELQFKYYA